VIGTILILIAVVLVLALALGGVALARSRRRSGGTTTIAPPGAPPSPPPQAAPTAAAPVSAGPATAPAPVAEPEVEAPGAPPSYRSRLGGVRGLFSGAVSALRSGRIDESTWESLEEALIRADVGVSTTGVLLDELRAKVQTKEISGGDDLLEALGASIRQLLDSVGSRALRFDGREDHPDVWLFVGVNGVGKTTTIGKLARRQHAAGQSVLLAAGDTFRAAAAEQLAMWAERTGAEIVRGGRRGRPERNRVRRRAASGGEEERSRPGRHGGAAAHQGEPGGGAEEDPADRRP